MTQFLTVFCFKRMKAGLKPRKTNVPSVPPPPMYSPHFWNPSTFLKQYAMYDLPEPFTAFMLEPVPLTNLTPTDVSSSGHPLVNVLEPLVAAAVAFNLNILLVSDAMAECKNNQELVTIVRDFVMTQSIVPPSPCGIMVLSTAFPVHVAILNPASTFADTVAIKVPSKFVEP